MGKWGDGGDAPWRGTADAQVEPAGTGIQRSRSRSRWGDGRRKEQGDAFQYSVIAW